MQPIVVVRGIAKNGLAWSLADMSAARLSKDIQTLNRPD